MPLTEQQRTEFRRQLRQQHAKLRDEIRHELLRSDNESYGAIAGRVHDSGDEAVADLLADVNLSLIDRQVNEIRAIENALQRLAEGSYGLCSDCGCDIPEARLAATPTVTRCLRCQERFERIHEAAPSL